MTSEAIIFQLIPSIRVGDYRAFYIERQYQEQLEISIKLNNFSEVSKAVEDIHRNKEEHQGRLKEFGGSAASIAAYYGAIITSTTRINSLESSISTIKSQIIIQLYIQFIQELASNAIRFLQLQSPENGTSTERLYNDSGQRNSRREDNYYSSRGKEDYSTSYYKDEKGRGIHNED